MPRAGSSDYLAKQVNTNSCCARRMCASLNGDRSTPRGVQKKKSTSLVDDQPGKLLGYGDPSDLAKPDQAARATERSSSF